MYGTIPIAASFSKHGMRHDWLAAFMMSSMLLNPQLIMYSTALGVTALYFLLGALKIVLGMKRFLLYLAFVMTFSLVTGLVVNVVV